MKNKNIYKPRYKIPFQAKSKNWPYKNCRMRRFFNIRGRKLQRRGIFKRVVLVFNNMKWAVARRYVKPYSKRRRPVRKSYSKAFYTKQQIRHFYGKVKESAFRKFLRHFLISVKWRNNSFFAALERRLDMVVFRMKFLPTIFACNQLVHHYGIYVNRRVEKTPHCLVRVGDIIKLPKTRWNGIFFYMYQLILFRSFGNFIGARRQFRAFRKKIWWLRKSKKFKRKNYSLVRKKMKICSFINLIKPKLNWYKKTLLTTLKEHDIFFNPKKSLKRYVRLFLRKPYSHQDDEKKKIKDKIYKNEEINPIISSYVQNSNKGLSNDEVSKKIKLDNRMMLDIQTHLELKLKEKYFQLKSLKTKKILNKKKQLNKLVKDNSLELKKDLIAFFFIKKNKKELPTKLSELFNESQDLTKNVKRSSSILNLNEESLSVIRINNLFDSIFKILTKSKRSVLTNFKKSKLKKRLLYKWKYRKNYIYFLKALTFNYNFAKTLNFIWMRLRLEELKQYRFLLNKIYLRKNSQNSSTIFQLQDMPSYRRVLRYIIGQEQLIKMKFKYINDNLIKYHKYVLKRKFKLKKKKRKGFRSMMYFFARRKRKKQRKLFTLRLRYPHWYIPNYLNFDFTLLAGMLINTPMPKDIHFSFRCSLKKIYSFYRSRGY